MADGIRVDPRDDGAEQAALADEARLIRRTRWRLVAWSGISTLLVLVVLGAQQRLHLHVHQGGGDDVGDGGGEHVLDVLLGDPGHRDIERQVVVDTHLQFEAVGLPVAILVDLALDLVVIVHGPAPAAP